MKRNILHILQAVVLLATLLSSCNYLDVVPPEQPTEDDTMTQATDAVGFIESCYIGVETTNPFTYDTYEWSTDETVNPPTWNDRSQQTAWGLYSPTNAGGYWDQLYGYLGQCHQFLRILARNNPLGATENDRRRWIDEAEFLKAFYHARLLALYGPIPIVDERLPQSILPSEMPGRSHYDYGVKYVVDKLDTIIAHNYLPAMCSADDWGRATIAAAYALKGRVLLYAASDLWNGKFPYEWKNSNYETPGYGYELVSHTYNRAKWELALDANLEALEYALGAGGRQLIDMDNIPSTVLTLPLPYIPGVDNTTPEGQEFAKRVMMLRTIQNSYEDTGNHEIIWGVFLRGSNTYLNFSALPKHVMTYNNQWWDGWCTNSATLNSVWNFYTSNGKLPAKDPEFSPQEQWYTSAGVSGRPEVINLNVNREPRFYATFSFDGDDHSPVLAGGKPLRINLRSSEAQGYNPEMYNRDYVVTGYLTKKYIAPEFQVSTSGSDNRKNYPRPLFRLAELYLNIAECYAALGGEDDKAREYLNVVRRRAGVPELQASDITPDQTMMDWVRSERFIELWGEGHRYYDVRRWMIAPKVLTRGVRRGLNVQGAGENPSFEALNTPVVINQQFIWDNRMYLWPISSSEIYNNPQLVQAPGY